MSAPVYSLQEARDRDTFLALMWSLSYPGRLQSLPTDPWLAISTALLDLETSFYTPDAMLNTQLLRTGARALAPDIAAYHLYPTCDEAALSGIRAASVGSALYPDTAATLVIACSLTTGRTMRLRGPGIQNTINLQTTLPAAVWDLRARHRFPLGWDIFLVDSHQVVGLPRSTTIEG